MIINFGTYKYNNPYSKDKNEYNSTGTGTPALNKFAYNPTTFQEFVSAGDYEGAVNYLNKFRFDDIDKQRQLNAQIKELERVGRINNAIYNSITDPQVLESVKFADALEHGNFSKLVTNTNKLAPFDKVFAWRNVPDGNISDKFVTWFNRLGSDSSMEEDKIARSLSVTFEPPVQKRFGIDFIKKDNTNTFDKFIKNLGITTQELQNSGVQINVENNDITNGKTTITFDKTNPYAIKMIMALDSGAGGLHGDGNADSILHAIKIKGYNNKGQEITTNGFGDADSMDVLAIMHDIVKEARDTKSRVLGLENDGSVKYYTSTVGPVMNDELEQLKALHDAGYIDDKQFASQSQLAGNEIFNALRGLGSSNQRMYSNGFNKEPTDMRLEELDNEQRAIAQQAITAALRSPKSITTQAMVSDGEYGVLISIDAAAAANSDLNDDSTLGDLAKTRQFKIFLPGFMSQQVQAKLDANTSTRAINEINSMQDYGYAYDLQDGTRLKYNGDGTFMVTNADGVNLDKISKDKAQQYINKSMIIEDSIDALKYEHMNAKGEIIDRAGYEQTARIIAMNAANELYPDLPLVGDAKSKEYNEKEIFDNHKYNITNTQYEMWKKLSEVYDIYERILAELTKYN